MLKHTPTNWLKLSLFILFLAVVNIYPQVQKVTYKVLGITVVGNKDRTINDETPSGKVAEPLFKPYEESN